MHVRSQLRHAIKIQRRCLATEALPGVRANDGTRTRYPLLGRQACNQLHLVRKERQAGFEPATSTLARLRATSCATVARELQVGIEPTINRFAICCLPIRPLQHELSEKESNPHQPVNNRSLCR